MIEAYEIGIQILLQDDVSAGLSVISMELAEVDRAISAASADLVKLAQNADHASRAVIRANTEKPLGEDRQSNLPNMASEQGLETNKWPEVDRYSLAEVEIAPLVTVQPPGEKSTRLSDATETLTSNSRPAETSTSAPSSVAPSSDEGEKETLVKRNKSEGLSQAPQVPSAKPAILRTSPDPHELKSDEQRLDRGTSQLSSLDAVTVSPLGRTSTIQSAPVTAAMRSTEPRNRRDLGRGRDDTVLAHENRQARETAPIQHRSSREGRPIQANNVSATSPTQDTRSGPGRELSGTVMLDGRLVGQLLGDLLTRDASRPPSGTSFFDPRQTPAWHNSGSL